MKAIKAFLLKRKARHLYQRMSHMAAQAECGHSLHKAISAEYAKVCNDLNSVMDKLVLVDRACPTQRF